MDNAQSRKIQTVSQMSGSGLNQIKIVTYQADELADDLREFLRLLNEGKIDECKSAVRDWIVKLRG